jgi:hypothetical protein
MKTPYYQSAIYKAKEHIEELKKQIEWSKVDIFGHYETNLYILSKHPEIIPKEDYRKFLRQSIEKIKLGVSNVEEAVKNDTHGVQIVTGDYGKSIWYADNEEDKKERDEYYELPEVEQDKSKYGKKLKYVEKFNESLFKKDDTKYVGISDLEFRNSKALLEYMESLLEKKETVFARKEETAPQDGNQTNKTISVLIYLLTVFFIILKLTDSVDWNWFAVISPVLIWKGFGFIISFLKALNK